MQASYPVRHVVCVVENVVMSNADVPMPSTDPRGVSTYFKAPPPDLTSTLPFKKLAKGFDPEEWRQGIDICLDKVEMNRQQQQEWSGECWL